MWHIWPKDQNDKTTVLHNASPKGRDILTAISHDHIFIPIRDRKWGLSRPSVFA